MGVIKDKLDAEWAEKVVDEKQFAVRADIEDLYNNITQFLSQAGENYPTGDATFDDYVEPIKDEIITFKALLDGYSEFIGWRQP
jgi:hypothetical protein